MRPDEQALRQDVASLAFRIGERRGKWELRGIKFPFALFFVAAAAVPNGPAGFLLRSECSGYSGVGPTSQLWHGGLDVPLAANFRPRSAHATMEAFKDWQNCLYHPIDRVARDHNNWHRDFPERLWTPDREISFLLETVYDLLHGSEYVGASLFPPRRLTCRRRLWNTILKELRDRGRGVRESGGFLLGRKNGEVRCIKGFIPYDTIDPDCLRGSILFDGSKMDLVWSECRARNLQVVADVHTHPGGYQQSSTDRAQPNDSGARTHRNYHPELRKPRIHARRDRHL